MWKKSTLFIYFFFFEGFPKSNTYLLLNPFDLFIPKMFAGSSMETEPPLIERFECGKLVVIRDHENDSNEFRSSISEEIN